MDAVTVGIDIGTTSVKAVLADAEGHVLARCRLPHSVRASSAARFEHDANEVWVEGVRATWQRLSTGPEVGAATGREIVAVTVAAMVPSLCGVDVGGRPVTTGLLYGDARGRSHPGGEAAGFARWLADTATTPSSVMRLWPAQAVANHELCGVGAIDTSTAMTLVPLFDGRGWAEAACAAAGIAPSQLPQIGMGAAAIGRVGGGPDGPLVGAGTIDAVAEQLVSAATRPGDVLVICGTTLIPLVLTEDRREVEGLWAMPYSVPGVLAVGGASNAGGLFVDWVRALVGSVADQPFEALAPTEVPVWLPYLRGERTPLHDPDRRAELLDAELGQGPVSVLRAAYEASGFVLRHHIDLATDAAPAGSAPPVRVVATGGGTRSQPWMQALADATGLPVDVAEVPEGAALGAAFLGRITAGLESATSDGHRWSRLRHRIEPRPAWVEACETRYRRFRDATEHGAGSGVRHRSD